MAEESRPRGKSRLGAVWFLSLAAENSLNSINLLLFLPKLTFFMEISCRRKETISLPMEVRFVFWRTRYAKNATDSQIPGPGFQKRATDSRKRPTGSLQNPTWRANGSALFSPGYEVRGHNWYTRVCTFLQ